MNSQSFSNCLWSLSVLEFNWYLSFHSSQNKKYKELFELIKNKISVLSSTMCFKSISSIYYSLSKLSNLDYNTLDSSIKNSLQTSFVKNSEFSQTSNLKINASEIAIIVYSLGKLNAKFSSLSYDIISNNEANSNFDDNVEFDTQKKIESKKKSMNEFQFYLLNNIEKNLFFMNEQELGNTIWGLLGQMEFNFKQLPLKFRNVMIDAVIKKQNYLKKQALVSILQSLYSNDDKNNFNSVSWKDLPTRLQASLLSSCQQLFSKEQGSFLNQKNNHELKYKNISRDSKLAANILFSLGRLKLRWHSDQFSNDFKTLLLSQLPTVNSSVNGEEGVNGQATALAFNGIARMDLKWQELESNSKDALENAILASCDYMTAGEIASVFWSLAKMNVSMAFDAHTNISFSNSNAASTITGLNRLTVNQLFQAFVRVASQMNPREFAWLLWSLAKLDLKFFDFELPMQNKIILLTGEVVSEMTSKDLCLILWSLSSISAPINDFPLSLRTAVIERMEDLVQMKLKFNEKLTYI
jgi:hypothetical protein